MDAYTHTRIKNNFIKKYLKKIKDVRFLPEVVKPIYAGKNLVLLLHSKPKKSIDLCISLKTLCGEELQCTHTLYVLRRKENTEEKPWVKDNKEYRLKLRLRFTKLKKT